MPASQVRWFLQSPPRIKEYEKLCQFGVTHVTSVNDVDTG